MPKINLLDSKIYNQISAGEVVERPASVIKEIVENSLDAGASNITIEISAGGTKLIKVSDNGCGIDFDDLKKAFLPHATSKISSTEDLYSISTLGFRGEALASIGAVSQTEIISKPKYAEMGGKISISGGVIEEPEICACNDGTVICVKNLFYNTPARLKFLKSTKQEESAITNIIERLILSHPNISFKYIVDGKTVYNSVLKGLSEKIYTIYGKNVSQSLINVNAHVGNYELSGYISMPTACKANRTYQTIIINGRYVSNPLISAAISNAYANFLMKGKFPLFILDFKIPYEDIDVNVHPSKMEVRFKDTKSIYDFFYSSILNALQDNNFPVEIDNLPLNTTNLMSENKVAVAKHQEQELKQVKNGFSFGDLQKFSEEIQNINVKAPVYFDEQPIQKSFGTLSENNIPHINEETPFENNIEIGSTNLFIPEEKKVVKQESLDIDLAYKVIGTLFNTYVLIESEENFYMIDQHAGHERVLFDRFMDSFNANKMNSQPLLLPYVFDVNQVEKTLIENNLLVFEQMGFTIDKFGNNSYRISAVPAMLSGINIEEFVTECLEDINKISSNNELIKNHFATCACKAAVKGGQDLSDIEIKTLLNLIIKSGCRLQCPHGRPICIKLTKYEIEKMFKRIV